MASGSCLSEDAFAHFQQREQELLKINSELEAKKASALNAASAAIRDAENSDIHRANVRPMESSYGVEDPLGIDSRNELRAAAADGSRPVSASSRPGSAGGNAIPSASQTDVESLHSTIRFQKARIIALQEEMDRTIRELGGRDDEVQRLRGESKGQVDELKRLKSLLEKGDQERERLKKQVASAELRVKDVERENADLRKECDGISLQLRKSETESHAKDARINRLMDDCERYKTSLKELKHADKDKQQSDRREVERLTSEVRKLERQRSELFGAFKKQMKLIDVLKKQKAHVEAARLLSFTEDEFIRILELGDKLG